MGRKIKIVGDHAEISSLGKQRKRELGFKRQQSIIERETRSPHDMLLYTHTHALANLFYPKIFPELIASSRDRKATYSTKIVLDKKSQKGIEAHYARLARNYFTPEDFSKHVHRVEKRTKIQALRLFGDSGIFVNPLPMNIGVSKKGGNLIFFEIAELNIPILQKKVNSLPEGTPEQKLKKKQAIALFMALKKEARGRTEIKVHPAYDL